MNLQKLYEALEVHLPLSEEYKAFIAEKAEFVSLPKDYMLLAPPGKVEHIFFLQEGFAMSFVFNDWKKQTTSFWGANSFVALGKSFFDRLPSTEFVQLMAPSKLLCFSLDTVETAFDKFPEAHIIYRKSMNIHAERLRERLQDIQKLSVALRHQKLLAQYPGIEQMVAQEHIASYLGIAPQSLSRMKKRLG